MTHPDISYKSRTPSMPIFNNKNDSWISDADKDALFSVDCLILETILKQF